jgi:hypothetical protein
MSVATASASPEARVTTEPSSSAASAAPIITTGVATSTGMLKCVFSIATP